MSGYSDGGASLRSTLLRDWLPDVRSAESDIDANWDVLRRRSGDLARNSAIGAAAIGAMVRGVIGSGIKVYPRLEESVWGLEERRSWERGVRQAFERWTRECDYAGRNTFYELQSLLYELMLTDGDVFCVYRRVSEGELSLRLQVIEGGRVYSDVGSGAVNGCRLDHRHRLYSISVANHFPREAPTSFHTILARNQANQPNFLHICQDLRANQIRGVPLLAPVIVNIKQLHRFSLAELSSAIVKSFFSLFFVQPQTDFDLNDVLGRDSIDLSDIKLGSGTLTALPQGVDVKAVDSSHSISTFSLFNQVFEKHIAAAIGIPAEVLFQSFQSSYSASRAALLQAYDEFKRRRLFFIHDFVQPVYLMWLQEAVARRIVHAPGFFSDPHQRELFSQADFFGPALPALDPLKEMQAAKLRVDAGVSSWQREAAELTGTDFFQNIQDQPEL